ncbi:MAG: bifunctional riboflavin kinase/FAD synthetase [Acidobacteria bacterium]|nr:bifunctional riboflavin kinase/FAD synthetase [Acidobacteriota bacterium]
MDVIHFPDGARPARWRDPALALGNFDGMHRGHAKLIERVARVASERSLTPVVLIFDPHPTRIVRPEKAPPLLMTEAQKLEALEHAGMHGVAIVRFTPEIAHWEPEMFVRSVLVDWLHVGEVWVGANFLFGHDRSGNFSLLRQLGARLGFKAEKIDPVRYKEFVVSSTRIRRLIAEGRVDEAAALLGHHYFVDGTVVHGDARGRTLGYPTANLQSANELLPPHGVYATMVSLGSTIHPSITNVGVRPTFGAGLPAVIETFLFDFDGDLYGSAVRLWFVQRLRDERTFDTVEALLVQIKADCARARALFERISL